MSNHEYAFKHALISSSIIQSAGVTGSVGVSTGAGTEGQSGAVSFVTGAATRAGSANVYAGGDGADLAIEAGATALTSAVAGAVQLNAGQGADIHVAGGAAERMQGGDVILSSGRSTSASSGTVGISTADASAGSSGQQSRSGSK